MLRVTYAAASCSPARAMRRIPCGSCCWTIACIRAAGVDREIFTLCKNEKYGQLIENLENVEDSASQMADFALSGQTVAQADHHAGRADCRGCGRCAAAHPQHRPHGRWIFLPDGTVPLAENEEEAE